jgi:ubiquinone/menaquinone biosynthesis C-methylase UbiE
MRWFFHHLYTTIAFAYDAVAWLSSFGAWDAWRRTALLDLPRDAPVLEIGSGTGHLLSQAVAGGHRAFAADASPQMTRRTIRRLRQSRQPAVVLRARAQALPFDKATFAACVSTFPSEYIFDPATLSEMRRVLAPEGRLVIVASVGIRPRTPWESFVRGLYALTGQAPIPDDRWLEPLRRAGFESRFNLVSIPGADVIQIIGRAA